MEWHDHLGMWLTALWLVYAVGLGVWVVMQKREPAATLAWVFSLLFLPYLGFLVFYLFGPRKLRRSESRRRSSYEAIRQAYAPAEAQRNAESPHDLSVQLAKLVQTATGMPLSTCDRIQLLVNGSNKYDAVLTGSGAMFAEAVHSLADCGNQGLLLLGMKRARRPPTPDYPLGYGKEVYFWSFLVALMLFSVGGAFSVYEGVHKLLHPEPLERPMIGVGVLAFSLALEWWSLRACLQEVNRTRGKQPLWDWFRHSRDAEMIVVFGEQLAALLGLAAALAAVALSLVTGDPVYDAIGTLAIGVLLIVVAVFVAVEVKQLLIGQSVAPERREAIRHFLESRPEVSEVFNVITLQLGPDVMVAIQAHLGAELTGAQLMTQINGIEVDLRKAFPDVRWCFFEPDDSP
jgi:cation diffusion facilitator family transporter